MDFFSRLAEHIKERCEDFGEVDFRNSYSGRGMYGKQCVGITGSETACMSLISAVIVALVDEVEADEFPAAVDTLMSFSRDNMGLDIIVYWPQIAPLDNEDDKEDNEE